MVKNTGRMDLRNALVVFQFTVAVCLMTGTLVVWQQLRFIRNMDIGYDREHVIVIPLRDDLVRKNGNVLSDELRRHDNVLAVSGSEYIPLERNNINTLQHTNEAGETTSVSTYTCEIGYDFFDVFGIQIIEGRPFSREFGTDEKSAILLNQTAVQALGMKDPIGNIFFGKFHVVGVVKDYHHSSLHDRIDPMMFFLRPNAYTFLSVRIKPGDIQNTLKFMKETVQKHSPYFAFEYYFQDDYFDEKYKSDQRFGTAFGYASGLAIMIACLGIFGLISFSTQRRTKEIAVRKVLGASVQNIYSRLSREFIILVTSANLLAWPIAYFFMNKWLQNFACRVNPSVWIFILSGLAALAIALLTVSYQSIKAATTNPVEALYYE